MASPILELQQDCIAKNSRTSELLRKALLISKKLKIKEIEEWLYSELNGYEDENKVPAYRLIKGQVKMRNPVNGINMPVVFENQEEENLASVLPSLQSIASLEDLLESSNDSYTMDLLHPIMTAIMRQGRFMSKPKLHIGKSQVVHIVDVVRTKIMEWALKMEENGVLGSGLQFSEKEKEVASSVVYNIGTMSNSQIQHAARSSTQKQSNKSLDLRKVSALVNSVSKKIEHREVSEAHRKEVEGDIESIKAQLKKNEPNQNVIIEGLKSLKSIFEGAVGGALGAGIVSEITKLLP